MSPQNIFCAPKIMVRLHGEISRTKKVNMTNHILCHSDEFFLHGSISTRELVAIVIIIIKTSLV